MPGSALENLIIHFIGFHQRESTLAEHDRQIEFIGKRQFPGVMQLKINNKILRRAFSLALSSKEFDKSIPVR